MSRLVYIFVYLGMWLLAIQPFSMLYLLSDVMYFFMHRVIRYRRGVVRRNLKKSFPEKSEAELRVIERKFYHYICDYMLESLKMLKMPVTQLHRRMHFENTEQYLEMIEKYGGIIVMMPHYANFEWTIGMGMFMKSGDIPMQVYKTIRNPFVDRLFRNIRSRFGGYNVQKSDAAREVIRAKHAGKKLALGLVADQSPNAHSLHYWTKFLNQDTAFMNGGERIARMMNYPVFYCELKKERRGYCEATFVLISECPKNTVDGEITEMYVRHVEQTILREPAYWFWSHKRWKHEHLAEQKK
ncbi:lysophospholipid acyltransferase family protein [Bacteroides ihuae]|uniref:lysophospholipid acyltransferase family protein n=1 Tax=Bacteroides ihuae TaxID=1852362 RepID=UPI00098F12EB|nr:lysophospholipid acyltransferase family protein [Bacteroides ihuae]